MYLSWNYYFKNGGAWITIDMLSQEWLVDFNQAIHQSFYQWRSITSLILSTYFGNDDNVDSTNNGRYTINSTDNNRCDVGSTNDG